MVLIPFKFSLGRHALHVHAHIINVIIAENAIVPLNTTCKQYQMCWKLLKHKICLCAKKTQLAY